MSFIKNQDTIIPVDFQILSIPIADQVVVRCKYDVHVLVNLSCDIIRASTKYKYGTDGTDGTSQQRKTPKKKKHVEVAKIEELTVRNLFQY